MDDDVVILEILKIFLASINNEDVKFACSGREAMAVIAANPEPFECILLDINMPEMTGIELLAQIRQIKTYEFVPVIMLTAMGDRSYIRDAFSAGAWDYILKPFEMFELEARIQNAGIRNAEVQRLAGYPGDRRRMIEFPTKLRSVEDAQGEPVHSAVVGADAFDNFYSSIVKQTPARLGVLTMIIDDFDMMTQRLSDEAFDVYLIELARQLTLEFSAMQSIISYQGEGVFMALSFAFDALGEDALKGAAGRAAVETDTHVDAISDHVTHLMVGRVLSSDLPENVEPSYMLEMARSHLLKPETLNC